MLYDFFQISDKNRSIFSTFIDGNEILEEDKKALVNMHNKFHDNLENYKKNLMIIGREETFTKEVYNLWTSYKDNIEKDLKVIEKKPHEAFSHFNLETKAISSLLAESIAKEIDFNYVQGVKALKQARYYSIINNFYIATLIMVLLINVLLFLKIRRTTNSSSGTNNSQDSFYTNTKNIEKLSEKIREISDAIRKQEYNLKNISQSILQMERVSKNNQESIIMRSISEKKLIEEFERLQNSVNNIDTLVNGKK
ncbi:hypothetical protein [Fluviispira sanaruensis]|uniref:hypothetical protein n=1 Tax=Fluviispira sanaruensis TaxID=2493639 RepID=UPI00102ECB84|nr:hypothetical protein [Fluviispira sanaruensis]